MTPTPAHRLPLDDRRHAPDGPGAADLAHCHALGEALATGLALGVF